MENPAETCPNCPFYKTKPGREPRYITMMLAFAMKHERRQKQGRRINSERELRPWQWTALDGLMQGRARWEEEERAREAEKHKNASKT